MGFGRPRIPTTTWKRRSGQVQGRLPSRQHHFPGAAPRILYQNDEKLVDADLTKPDQLVHVLDLFFGWRPPAFDEWEKAVEEFKGRVQELGENLGRLIHKRTANQRQVSGRF